MEIIFLQPICTHNIWGGSRLRTDFGYDVEGNDIGECWGISAHPNGDCLIKGGTYAGKHLSELWDSCPELFGYLDYDRYPLLIKIIDARDDLSIQVHPSDEYAMRMENGSFGKTECWYVLDCSEDTEIVIGHNANSKEELADMIHNGKWNEFIRRVPVKKGDFIQIDPGTVHAIKGGVLVLETQQNSDITYRVYDYDRLLDGKPRELHIDKSIDVIQVPSKPIENSIIHMAETADNELVELYSCNYYKIFKLQLKGQHVFEQKYPFLNVSVIAGEAYINGIRVIKGDHFIIPAGFGKVRLEGDAEMILSTD